MSTKIRKTITMPKTKADTWMSALRSDKFKQGFDSLETTDYDYEAGTNSPAFCCLGVLQCVVGKVQSGRQLPTARWLRDHKIAVVDPDSKDSSLSGDDRRNREVDIALDPPVPSKTYAGRTYSTVSALNDSAEFSFKEIAKILDKRIKRV